MTTGNQTDTLIPFLPRFPAACSVKDSVIRLTQPHLFKLVTVTSVLSSFSRNSKTTQGALGQSLDAVLPDKLPMKTMRLDHVHSSSQRGR